jgi:hypothetical protein
MKPLGQKAYGSIPHLTKSRLGEGDHHCDPGQERIATEKPRDRFDLVIVQEKLDGSNCSVAKINGEIIALSRAGYLAETSPFVQHHYFARWVEKEKSRFNSILSEGERIVGEWLLQAHSTRYNLIHEPFVPFDIMQKHERLTYHNFLLRVLPYRFTIPRLINIGQPMSVNWVLKQIEVSGHGAIDKVEGAIWRVENRDGFDFIVKFVRPDKQDGIYLPEVSNLPPVWNCDPDSCCVGNIRTL